MRQHADEHSIDVVPLGADHSERTWRRYFGVSVEPPFNPAARERIDRRKDIPDSWIFEAAVDLVAAGLTTVALCRDANLASALDRIGIKVFREPGDLVAELERQEAAQVEPRTAAGSDGAAVAAVQPSDPLADVLSRERATYCDQERRVLGFIAHLGSPSKDELWSFAADAGLNLNVARNTAERLALSGVVQDTGNHFLVPDKQLAQLARASVEAEIITLLAGGPADGL